MRVLTVEDNPATRVFVRLTLEGGGYEVVEAETGEAALRLVRDLQPEIVLIDLALPDMNGLELAERVRRLLARPGCRIVAFTGSLSEREAAAMRSGLLDDLLLKPAEPAELLDLLARTAPGVQLQAARGPALVVGVAGPGRTERTLEELGFHVDLAPPEATEVVASRIRPAVVVVPTILPAISGFELVWKLRRHPTLYDIPILLVSPCAVDDADATGARRVGADAVVSEHGGLGEMRAGLNDAFRTRTEDHLDLCADARAEYVSYLERCVRRQREDEDDGSRTSRRLARLALIEDVGRQLAATESLEDALGTLLAELVHLLGAAVGTVFISDADGDVTPRARVGPMPAQADDKMVGEVRRRWARGLFKTVILSSTSPPPGTAVLDAAGVHSMALVPLALAAERVGCILVGSQRDDLLTWQEFLDAVATDTALIVRLAVALETAAEGERMAHNRAQHDALTGLPNGVVVLRRLATLVASGATGALLLVGISRFRRVNARYGYRHGNLVLQGLAARLSADVAAPDVTLGRVGGERFAVVASALPTEGASREFANRLSALVAEPLVCEGVEHRLSASVGIVHFPAHGVDPQALLWRVDTAMRAAREGDRPMSVFDPAWDPEASLRLLVDQELRSALAQGGGGLRLGYQPIIDIPSRHIVGVEALLRWEHPSLGAVSPATVVAVAEESGLMKELGRWVLGAVCAQTSSWQRLGPLRPSTVSVNVAAQELLDESYVANVADMLRTWNVPGHALAVEITETAALQDLERSADLLSDVRALGVRIVLDDFGTGYSSLAYLRRLPLDAVKIDRSFVRELANDASNRAVVGAIVELAHNLGLTVVAEGVETEAQLDELSALGCDQAQGWLFAAAVSARELGTLVRNGSRLIRST